MKHQHRQDVRAPAEDRHHIKQRLREVYGLLLASHGPQHWWPADSPFEVIVGAILTQSAAWDNVEKAIANLKDGGALTPAALREIPLDELAGLIYPSGYYNAKALKLKALVTHLGDAHHDSLEKLFAPDIAPLRSELLAIHGIGPETADSIILYAAEKPVFVIDAYTRRVVDRLGLGLRRNRYSDYQDLFMDNLPADARLFNEYHALFVRHGKDVCKKTPLCDRCCLAEVCPRHL